MKALTPTLITPPSESPVSVYDAKSNCRIETTDEDPLITSLIAASTSYVEGYSGILGRALITQTWAQSFSRFPADRCIRVPLLPIQSITTIKYYDADDVEQTFDSAKYRLLTDKLGAYVELKDSESWPSTKSRGDAMTVTYVAGYGNKGSDVPPAIRQAILMMVGHFYENRELSAPITISEVPFAADALLVPFRRVGL